MLWLAAKTLRRAPRRLVLAAVAAVFPAAVLGSTLLFVQQSVHTMTRVALEPLQVEMRALATSLAADLGPVARDLQALPGVRRAERFGSADVIVSSPDGRGRVTARLFAIDPSYLDSHPWLGGASALGGHALLNSALRAAPGFGSPGSIRIDLPGDSKPLGVRVPIAGAIDLRAATTWFAIPAGEVQGDVAVVPRAVVVDYAVFQRSILPALRATFTGSTAVANPGLTDLPPASVELHLAIDHGAYPSDPGRAARWSAALQRTLERRAPGTIIVADNAAEPLDEASVDATNAKVLFLLLGIPGVLVAGALGVSAAAALEAAVRRENALLRLRGTTDAQLAKLAVLQGAVTWLAGSVIGLGVAVAVVSLAADHPAWQRVPTGQLVGSLLLAAAAGLVTTAVRLVPPAASPRPLPLGTGPAAGGVGMGAAMAASPPRPPRPHRRHPDPGRERPGWRAAADPDRGRHPGPVLLRPAGADRAVARGHPARRPRDRGPVRPPGGGHPPGHRLSRRPRPGPEARPARRRGLP